MTTFSGEGHVWLQTRNPLLFNQGGGGGGGGGGDQGNEGIDLSDFL